jgi:U3 small nucleolar RNA-associated protein 25
VNNMPTRPRDADFSRIRQWALDGRMRLFRQTVVLSAHKRADALSLFRGTTNRSGRVRIMPSPKADGSMSDVALSLRQRFLRVDGVTNPGDAPDRRFEEFMTKVLPELRSAVDCQALVVVPSYFDFVRVRNALVALEADEVTFHFASMSEYSKESDVARAKTRLFTGRVKLLLMTERIHYYWRSVVRGASTVVWYGVPENDHFYPEIVNTLAEAADRGRAVQSIALYDKFDAFALERIVGTARAKKMASAASRSVYLFSS